MSFFTQRENEVLQELNTQPKGLSSEEALKRLETYGRNELEEEEGTSIWAKIWAQFNDFLIFILLGAALISAFMGESKDALVILVIVIINAALGVYQEGQAEKSVAALRQMAAPFAKVLRDGKPTELAAAELVPGDIVLLEAGDIIPADLRLTASSNLKIDESSLTGESVPVEKDHSQTLPDDTGLGDRLNMAYMSSICTYGKGEGVVVGTGHNTEIGHIATKIQSFEQEETPLQQKLNQLGKVLGTTTIIVCILVFGLGMLQGREAIEMLLTSISLAVAAIPEGLPAIVTIVLSIGMNRMAKRHAIVKKLLAVETLGATSVICSDKTGTLTQNEMTVVGAYVDGKTYRIEGSGYTPEGGVLLDNAPLDPETDPSLMLLASMAGLANDAHLDYEATPITVIGDPTEGALVTFADKLGPSKEELQLQFPRIADLPFDSDRKMMTTFHRDFQGLGTVGLTKGAPDVILSRCNRIWENGEIVPITEAHRQRVMEENSALARQALRVLAFALTTYDTLPGTVLPDEHERDMVFVGLVGMIDPARPEAKEAIALCHQAGIDIVMITGDYKETAFAIAKDLGLVTEESQAIEGKELDRFSDEELRELVHTVRVYSRVSPDHKVRIVQALRDNGAITAMTGDGVNDSPALKKADIGVAMGITGTDVAKNTADLILTDDNFATIVSAVEEGRIIYANIKKFVYFLLSCNIGEILLVFVSILLGWPMPLLPIQLLWLNLVTDSFPAMALGVEPGEEGIMNQPPRNPEDPILDRSMVVSIVVQAVAVAGAALAAYYTGLKHYGMDQLLHARTIAFSAIIVAELLRALSARSLTHTIFSLGLFSNQKMIWALLSSFGLLLVVLYVPFFQDIFHTFALTGTDWAMVLSYSFVPLLLGEIVKAIRGKKHAS